MVLAAGVTLRWGQRTNDAPRCDVTERAGRRGRRHTATHARYSFPLSRTTLDLLVDDWAEAICANGMDLDEVVGDVEQLIGHLRAFEHTVRRTLLPVGQEKRTDDE